MTVKRGLKLKAEPDQRASFVDELNRDLRDSDIGVSIQDNAVDTEIWLNGFVVEVEKTINVINKRVEDAQTRWGLEISVSRIAESSEHEATFE